MITILKNIKSRTINWLIVVGAVGLIATALFFQHVLGIQPCIMCISQRVVVIAIGILALAAAIQNPRTTGIRVYGGAVSTCALIGASIAARQVYLQYLPPDQVPACGPSLDYLLEVFPLRDLLEMVFKGEGSCAEVHWTLFGISIPGWTLQAFVILALIGGYQALRPRPD